MSIYSPTGSFIHTAACLIIGDEILSSKTRDSNSQFFAKYCFDNGIDLKRIEVVPDEEPAIVDSTKRLSSAYDFVITSGGIGPTHDDITYLSIAKAFNLEVRRHAGTVERMKKLARDKDGEKIDWDAEDQQAVARNRLRMAEFPYSSKEGEVKVVWPHDDLWVPVVGVRNVHILPGVPSLFQKLLEGLKPMLKTDPGHKLRRIQIRTPLPESSVADLLRSVQESLDNAGKDVKIGSYPRYMYFSAS